MSEATPTPISANLKQEPLIFEEFFESGLEETSSPFLTPSSRKWSINLHLKASLVAAFLLFLSFALSWFSSLVPFSNALLLFVYFLAGIPSLIESLEDLLDLQVNIDVLMTLAAFGSVIIGSPMEGALLLVLFSLSAAMEEAVTAKAKNTISALHKLSPTKACVMNAKGFAIDKSIKEVTVGTHILIKAGELVPLDGVVVKGVSSVNLVHLTGENTPLTKKVGDEVAAGAQNLDGVLVLEVTHTSSDSTLTRIIKLVTQAQHAKPKLQRWFDNLSRTYALAIISASALFAIGLTVMGLPFLGLNGALYRALAFLIAASPCALIIAIPIAYLSAISSCASQGVLLKGGITLDALASCHTIAFDKTGTLTTGELKCIGFESLSNISEERQKQFLSIALAMEQNALHPIAKAIVAYATQLELSPYPIEQFSVVPGYGLQAKAILDGKNVAAYLSNMDFIKNKIEKSSLLQLNQKIEHFHASGELVAILLVDKELLIFRFQDTLRPNVKTTINALKDQGYRLLMLSGDHELSAKKIAQETGISDYYAQLKPEDKLRFISEISKKENLVMVGDGINDAPALARATVGISMGKMGSAAAMDASDVVLLHDNVEKLDWLMHKANATQRIVKQNLAFASLAIIVASLPALLGIVPLWLAVLMHEGGTVLVGLNGLRLSKR
ncbi:putative cadmium/zinc-transporting ATPase HMA1, chloroplastic [Chlamydiales bacterium STE3]|nr:putative cadmium/zinc-transporting ATPase HMA1, chloroplastic [Chlamydiales bacterium STE3]